MTTLAAPQHHHAPLALALLLAAAAGAAAASATRTDDAYVGTLDATNGTAWAQRGQSPPRGFVALSCEQSQGCILALPPPDAGVLHVPPCKGREGWAPPGDAHIGACWTDLTLPLDLLRHGVRGEP